MYVAFTVAYLKELVLCLLHIDCLSIVKYRATEFLTVFFGPSIRINCGTHIEIPFVCNQLFQAYLGYQFSSAEDIIIITFILMFYVLVPTLKPWLLLCFWIDFSSFLLSSRFSNVGGSVNAHVQNSCGFTFNKRYQKKKKPLRYSFS